MPAAIAIPALISGGSSVLSGILGSRAANTAAGQQAAAQQQIIDLMTGLPGRINPGIQAASDAASAGVMNAAGQSGAAVSQAAANAGQQISQGAAAAGQQVSDAAGAAQAGMSSAVAGANNYLNPYAAAGQGALANLSDLAGQSQQYDASQLTMDPGYQFRLQEGMKVLERSAAARGAFQTGGTLKSLVDYSQGAASQEFQNAYQRFRQGQQDRFSMLSGVAGMGLQAGGQAGQNLLTGAQYSGNIGQHAADLGAGYGFDAANAGANLGYNAAQYGGNLNYGAAQYAGNMGYQSAAQQGQNQLWSAAAIANALSGRGAAQAAGTIGSANAWQSAIGGLANAGGQFAAGYPWGGGMAYQPPLGRLPGLGYGAIPIPGMGGTP